MKIIGNYTTTEGLDTTRMLIDGFYLHNEHSDVSAYIWEDELTEYEKNDPDRFYCLGFDDEGKIYACTGTTDLECYTEIEL